MNSNNGNGNGHRHGGGNPSGHTRIDRKIAELESQVNALRLTRELLYGDALTSKRKRTTSVLDDALALEETRHARRRKHAPGSAGGKYSARSLKERRQASADYLAEFSTTTPRPAPDSNRRGVGSLVRRGYLARRGNKGYVRTSKEYIV